MANEFSFANSDGSELVRRKRIISVTASTKTLRQINDEGKVVKLDRASGGVTVTLPRATGSGDVYRIAVGTALGSGSYIVKVAIAADFMRGKAWLLAASNASFATSNSGTLATESDTITLNGGTTGGLPGDYVELTDVAKNNWHVEGSLVGVGTAATPFSATV
jgi:hypothetical protein